MRTTLLIKLVSACVLSSPFMVSAGEPIEQFQFYSGQRYQIKAVDIFRMGKKYPEQGLNKKLRPLMNHVFISEQALKSALLNRLDADFVAEHFNQFLIRAELKQKKLKVTVLDDALLRLSYLDLDAGQQSLPEYMDISELKKQTQVEVSSSRFATKALQGKVDLKTLCVELSDNKGAVLAGVCPDSGNGILVSADKAYQLHGLGQEFSEPGEINGSWNGKVRHSGNKMEGFNGGATGNTQFPILYASQPQHTDFALMLNNTYSAEWDFSRSPWSIKPASGQSDLLFFSAETTKELRSSYMKMVGKPLVPPRKMFGLWLSEYGFDNWQELDDKLETLKQNRFPIDGVVMDLQWFGNVSGRNPLSQMGSLTWDRHNFPDPEGKIQQLKKQGVGMMLIEESYVSEGLESFKVMEESGYLAKDPESGKALDTDPANIGHWWGKGGMIDWTNPQAGKKWHDWKRAPLVNMGIIGHWTDLGEPEMFNGKGVYFNDKPHKDIHNLYNYKWLESIYNGYQEQKTATRPFMMSRSGAPGIQKFGASMWSADIGSNLSSLAVHIGMQQNMMLSGIDYYGSDIGGFHRGGLRVRKQDQKKVLDETYTQWFAYSSLFDVPVRPHTENLCNCKETAPDRVGDMNSNRFNLMQRYRLVPYLYSLAHRAAREAKPLYSSLGFNYPDDPEALRENHKMIGEDLLAVAVARLGQTSSDVYLPEGEWYDFHTGQLVSSEGGETLKSVPLRRSIDDTEVYTLPLYVRSGAILPLNETVNSLSPSQVPEQLALRIYGLPQHSEFTLYEDDGTTNAYQSGAVREALITAQSDSQRAKVEIVSNGNYSGVKQSRPVILIWAIDNKPVTEVKVNGELVSEWSYQNNQLTINAGRLDMSKKQIIEVGF